MAKKNTRRLELVQQINEFKIYNDDSCMSVRYSNNVAYFSSIEECLRHISGVMLRQKLSKRKQADKEDIKTMLHAIEEHVAWFHEITHGF